jgi:hypothetical protein
LWVPELGLKPDKTFRAYAFDQSFSASSRSESIPSYRSSKPQEVKAHIQEHLAAE